ncbi:MAG: MBL fold metallo-hydrolase [Anaerolineaceae bacterium]|nr:MBL fold metallo-hydrolase [Anaerolineaceae bacterium]
MNIRFLGHSCIEIMGQHHILIDPDFTREPEEGVEYILVSHAHRDHIGRIAEMQTGIVVASEDVCQIAFDLGIPRDRLFPISAGDQIENIQILPGFSMVGGLNYSLFYFLFRRRLPDPGGTPLSFLIKDEITILHIGDAHKVKLEITPDILCVPWRTPPFGPKKFKKQIATMVRDLSPKYIIPIHYDIPGMEADTKELHKITTCRILDGNGWYLFNEAK